MTHYWEKLHSKFEYGLLLKNDISLNSLIIAACDPKLDCKNQDVYIPLDSSAFSIVQKSKHPYHGPIHSDSGTPDFFENFLKKPLPQHLTLYPIMNNSHQIEYILVCVGIDTSLFTDEVLSFVKDLSTKIEQDLKQTTSKKQAA